MGTDFSNELYDLHHGNVSEIYPKWPAPDLIISDGAYGVRGFRGDTTDAAGLIDWYQPHILEIACGDRGLSIISQKTLSRYGGWANPCGQRIAAGRVAAKRLAIM